MRGFLCLQIPATQPLVVLATCQLSPEELPPVLLSFFQALSSCPTTSSRKPSQQQLAHVDTEVTQSAASEGAKPDSTVRSSDVIQFASEVESAGSWSEAVTLTAEAAARHVASASVLSLHCKLVQAASAATQLPAHSGLLQNSPRPVAGEAGVMQSNVSLAQAEHGAVPQLRGGASKGARAVNVNELQQGFKLHAEVYS